MRFNKEDFKDMTFNPFKDRGSNKYLWDMYPSLKLDVFLNPLSDEPTNEEKEIYRTWRNPDSDQLLAFVILFVDPESPILVKEKDYNKRMQIVFEVLEMQQSRRVRAEIENDTEYYKRFIYAFFLTVNNSDYEMWYSLRVNYANTMEILRAPLEIEDPVGSQTKKTDLAKKIGETKLIMEELEAKLFHDERLHRKILAESSDEFASWAERFAQDLPYLKYQHNGN